MLRAFSLPMATVRRRDSGRQSLPLSSMPRGSAPIIPCGSQPADIALRAPSRSPPGALRRAFQPEAISLLTSASGGPLMRPSSLRSSNRLPLKDCFFRIVGFQVQVLKIIPYICGKILCYARNLQILRLLVFLLQQGA